MSRRSFRFIPGPGVLAIPVVLLLCSLAVAQQSFFQQPDFPQPPGAPSRGPPAPAGKAKAPANAAQEEALKLVRELYKDEHAKAKTAQQKEGLARQLMRKAAETENDPTARFVLLRVARDVAAQAGRVEVASEAIDQLASAYEIDSVEMRLAAITKAAAVVTAADECDKVANLAHAAREEALQQDDFERAVQLGVLAVNAARKGKRWELARQFVARDKEAEALAKVYQTVQTAKTALEKDATDPAANLTVGQYLCFSKDDWEQGIPMLALGSDAALKDLAAKELDGARDASSQVALGDAWWDLAAQQSDRAKRACEGRAGYWYRRSQIALTGLIREKVEKRLASLAANDAGAAASKDGTKGPRTGRTKVQNKVYKFTDETTIKKDWTLDGDWRLEGGGLRMERGCSVISKDRFDGDFTIDLAIRRPAERYSAAAHFSLLLFGETLNYTIERDEIVRIQRQGTNLAVVRMGMRPHLVGIKEQAARTPSSLTIRLTSDYSAAAFIVQGMAYAGANLPTR